MSATSTAEIIGTQTLAKASQLDPEPISKSILGIAAQVVGLFSAAHQAALAREASTLNNATPTFIQEVQAAMSALSDGAISQSQAIAYLQQAQSDYYATVGGIIKKGGPCVAKCVIGAQSNIGKPEGWISTEPICCNNSGTCNAACCIGCYLIEPTVAALTEIIKEGTGTYTIPSSQSNGAIKGTPLVTITYSGSSVLNSIGSLTGTIEGVLGIGSTSTKGTWVVLALIALAIFGIVRAVK